MTPLAGLVTKFGGGLPAGMLQADGGAKTLLAARTIKFDGGLPVGMLLVDNGAEDAFSVPVH